MLWASCLFLVCLCDSKKLVLVLVVWWDSSSSLVAWFDSKKDRMVSAAGDVRSLRDLGQIRLSTSCHCSSPQRLHLSEIYTRILDKARF